MSAHEWDGSSYDRISTIQQGLGAEVLARLQLEGDETVLDAGCGSGRISEMLAARLPHGRVIALDASASMLVAARERLARLIDEERVQVLCGDLLELELEQPLDAILSTATFHWIADHERLFTRLRAALRPGGRLVAQCGGEGNISGLRGRARELLTREPYAAHFAAWRTPWNYAPAEPTRERLLAAGFAHADCWLEPAPREPDEPREFLATIVFGPHVQQLPPELREQFIDDIITAVGEPVVIDYVRLNIDATA